MTASTAPEPARIGRRFAVRLRYVVGVGAAVVLTGVVLPAVSGVPWTTVVQVLTAVPLLGLAGLVVLWFAGLLAHTVTLTAALPGLTHRRALTLSLTGSAVANVLPLGGAAGVALNCSMARRWGFGGPEIGAYTVVTNAWDLLVKFLVPLLTLPTLLAATSAAAPHLARAAGVSAVALAVVAVTGSATLVSARATDRVGRLLDRALGWWRRVLGRPSSYSCRTALLDLRASMRSVVTRHWLRLTTGMTLYTGLLFVLMLTCLTATGSGLGVGAVLTGFAVERVLTVAGITPGGAGVVELGVTSTLLAFPGSAVGVASGVLLYRLLTFGLEIPVGGLTLAGWLWRRRLGAVA